ncbi:MAG TPA: hypothetical protein ENK53_09020 [Thiotrichales bacterium]|nr:hypothetical protein [Thiotrichales bacterium]
MRHLLIAGFARGTTADEIRQALEKAGVPVTEIRIEMGNREGRDVALVGVDTDETGIRVLAERIDGFVWKGHRLQAEHTLLFE